MSNLILTPGELQILRERADNLYLDFRQCHYTEVNSFIDKYKLFVDKLLNIIKNGEIRSDI